MQPAPSLSRPVKNRRIVVRRLRGAGHGGAERSAEGALTTGLVCNSVAASRSRRSSRTWDDNASQRTGGLRSTEPRLPICCHEPAATRSLAANNRTKKDQSAGPLRDTDERTRTST